MKAKQKKQLHKKKSEEMTMEHAPRLDTILMVEDVLKNMNESVIKISELKRRLPKQVNHNTLKTILDYLDRSNKIYIGVKGITWVYNDSPKMKEALKRAISWVDLKKKYKLRG